MNYIYDILVNFQEVAYDFYEWNLDDQVEHIRKIPLFRTNTEQYQKLKNEEIVIEENLKDKIEKKTETFQIGGVEVIPYAILVSDNLEVLAIEFNHQGRNLGKSRLLIDEESEVLEVVSRIPENNLIFKAVKKNNYIELSTRKEQEMKEYIENKMYEIEKEQDEKLKYLYYECFNKKENSKAKILDDIKIAIKENKNNISNIIYNFFNLTKMGK